MIYLKNTSYSNNGLWTVETTDALFCLSKPCLLFFLLCTLCCVEGVLIVLLCFLLRSFFDVFIVCVCRAPESNSITK